MVKIHHFCAKNLFYCAKKNQFNDLSSNMKILLIFVLVLVNPALLAPQRPLSNSLSNCKENGIEYEQGAKIPTNDPCEYCECIGNGEKICFASKGQCWPWHLSFKNEWLVDFGVNKLHFCKDLYFLFYF